MTTEKLSNSTEICNARMLHDNLSESDKMLINAMANTMFALLQSVQCLQGGYNVGRTVTTKVQPPPHD